MRDRRIALLVAYLLNLHFDLEDGGSMYLRNVGEPLGDHMASDNRR
jgi:hypothetical protein